MLGHLNSFAKLPRMSPERLQGQWRGSETLCLGVNIRTCRQPVCAGNVQSELFHILEFHLLSVLPEAIVLFISCRSVLQKGYMLGVLWLIGWPFIWPVCEDKIFAILSQEATGISCAKIFNITIEKKPYVALNKICNTQHFNFSYVQKSYGSAINYFLHSVLFCPENRTAREGHTMIYKTNVYRPYYISRAMPSDEIRGKHLSTLKMLSFY